MGVIEGNATPLQEVSIGKTYLDTRERQGGDIGVGG